MPFTAANVDTESRMLLQADQLVYDFDNETVTAIGNVQIYYQGYALDADQVTYDQKSGRLIATGGIRMLEPGGNLVTTEKLDITDDFRDGFIGSLNVITTDRTRFTAQTAERRDANLTIFRRGVYTACEPCLEHPERPPLWQIKAARIVHDKQARTIYYENARLEFFGFPVAYMPVFFHPDPTVTRKTGFLVPSVLQSDALGFGVTTPFFWNLAPNYDVTFSPTMLTRQGLLMQTQWRHQLVNGAYSIRVAGIFQNDPGAFVDNGETLSGDRDLRGSAATNGAFNLAEHWTFGWDLDLSSDRTFNRDYKIPDAQAQDLTSSVYLTGMSERNYFSTTGYYTLVQREDTEEDLAGGGIYIHDDQAEQGFVHPVIDHNYVLESPIWGGEARLDSNLASLTRESSDIRHPPAPYGAYYAGVAGTFTRATSRASWRRQLILPGGHLVTPFSYFQADADWVASDDAAAGLTDTSLVGRVMPAVGLEYEYPILASIGPTTHTFGPKAQIIARPNEIRTGDLPNEDSQSLEFDDTTLFKWDKFAGYDRQEGGTRANLGFIYQGLFPGGASVDAVVGRSFQIAGENSFALKDHALTGVGSGLETDDSDYLARVTVNTGLGVALIARSRFDDEDLTLNRADLAATAGYGNSSAGIDYTYLRESPASGIFNRREEISASAAIEVIDNWSVLASLVYDLRNDSRVSDSLGLAYADDCFSFSATYSETTDPYTDLVSSRQVFFRMSLRTVADGGFGRDLPVETQVQ
jgi:LPS-assembly protein